MLSARMGCDVAVPSPVDQFVTVRNADMQTIRRKLKWGDYGGLMGGDWRYDWGPVSDVVVGYDVWFAVDYPGAVADDYGRAWLHQIALWGGVPADTDPESAGFNHPIRGEDPIGVVSAALVAHGFRCPKPR